MLGVELLDQTIDRDPQVLELRDLIVDTFLRSFKQPFAGAKFGLPSVEVVAANSQLLENLDLRWRQKRGVIGDETGNISFFVRVRIVFLFLRGFKILALILRVFGRGIIGLRLCLRLGNLNGTAKQAVDAIPNVADLNAQHQRREKYRQRQKPDF